MNLEESWILILKIFWILNIRSWLPNWFLRRWTTIFPWIELYWRIIILMLFWSHFKTMISYIMRLLNWLFPHFTLNNFISVIHCSTHISFPAVLINIMSICTSTLIFINSHWIRRSNTKRLWISLLLTLLCRCLEIIPRLLT